MLIREGHASVVAHLDVCARGVCHNFLASELIACIVGEFKMIATQFTKVSCCLVKFSLFERSGLREQHKSKNTVF